MKKNNKYRFNIEITAGKEKRQGWEIIIIYSGNSFFCMIFYFLIKKYKLNKILKRAREFGE